MATIGIFTQTQTGFTGEITTLTIQAKKVAIVAVEERTAEAAPTHRIYLGKAEIGAGWAKRSSEGRDYLSVKIDDPSLPAALYARLFAEDDGKTHSLIWTRSNARRQD
ncbi:DUF736 domain-containing protein [Methylobacterium aquaticum]|jgi:uncharacterized protein (DUF736 family)|uniref:DUF736 domain-containing protein n=1 Tax=Methylobacterium aquaticum TaxID=270351 RepID=A0A0J6T171_9HYPH|nr:DUF736 domain-containing protein [Methylobacterium aquaticum]KMO39338.1 hypothetical protein VP06_04145 [Methylobacterium aquaticum]